MNQNLLLATGFGRRVGLRDTERLTAFLAAGHTPAQVIPNPRTGLERHYMSETDIAAFHERYLTHLTIAERFGEHRNTILVRLKAAGVTPFRYDGQDHGAIYLRHEAEAAYRNAGLSPVVP